MIVKFLLMTRFVSDVDTQVGRELSISLIFRVIE